MGQASLEKRAGVVFKVNWKSRDRITALTAPCVHARIILIDASSVLVQLSKKVEGHGSPGLPLSLFPSPFSGNNQNSSDRHLLVGASYIYMPCNTSVLMHVSVYMKMNYISA